MDHSLEGLAKERGARYLKFEFTGVKRPLNDPNIQTRPPQPEAPVQGFREETRVWVEPGIPEAGKTSSTVSPISKTVSPHDLLTPTGFSFFAGSLFLCIALLVLDTLPEGAFADVQTFGHFGADRTSERVYRLPELSAPIVVFGIASVLSFGYFLSWMVRILTRFFSRIFLRRNLGG